MTNKSDKPSKKAKANPKAVGPAKKAKAGKASLPSSNPSARPQPPIKQHIGRSKPVRPTGKELIVRNDPEPDESISGKGPYDFDALCDGYLPSPWTHKQFLFANHYLGKARGQASMAAVMAGYAKGTAKQVAYNILTRTDYKHVPAYIAWRRAKMARRYEITQERLIKEQAKIAFSNFLDYVSINEAGQPELDLSAMDDDMGSVIHSIEIQEASEIVGRKVKLRLFDKQKAIESLMKQQGMIVDKVEHTGKVRVDQKAGLDTNSVEKVARKLAFILKAAEKHQQDPSKQQP